MRFDRRSKAIMLSVGSIALLAACSGSPSLDDPSEEGADQSSDQSSDPSDVEQTEDVLGTSWEALSYPTCIYGSFSDPDRDGFGWEFNRTCVVYKPPAPPPPPPSTPPPPTGSGSTTQACSNPEGTDSVMAALAVSAANEMKRWQPVTDFAIGNQGFGEMLVLTSAGKSRCSDGLCYNTQALLDLQKPQAEGTVFPGNVKLSAVALRSRLVAKFRDQQGCERQPSNGGTTNCPAEQHQLIFQRSEKGGCDTNYYFVAKKPDGTPLQYPAQLKNKLLWADRVNPYIGFQSVGEVVSLDPTYGLDDVGTTSAGTCTSACVKVSRNNEAGNCCSCNGVTKGFKKAVFSSYLYMCQ
jgi:hypothetical protein